VSKAKIKKYREERRQAAPSTGASGGSEAGERVRQRSSGRESFRTVLGLAQVAHRRNRANVKQTAKDKSVAEAVKLARSLKK